MDEFVRRFPSASHAFGRAGEIKSLRVCLITSLSVADFVDAELTAESARELMSGNVGVLTLAAVLRANGYSPCVVNLDELFLRFREARATKLSGSAEHGVEALSTSSSQFESVPTEEIEASSLLPFVVDHLSPFFDVFGLGSICSSYPLTVRLAAELKKLNPNACTIVGGPQASVVDVATMEAFPWIDFVVRGEAEETLPALLNVLSLPNDWSALQDIPGVTFRRDGAVVRNPNAPAIKNLDDLPMPAFDLDADFQSRGTAYLEIGRGCPFACTFCSTNDFFRRNFRLKSTQKMISEMVEIGSHHNISSFSFIHDMYTIDHKKVEAFCEAVLACGEEFTWGCSARTDCTDDALIALMAKAGCRGIFFGIETGSARLQILIKKGLDLDDARTRIECADRHGVAIAVALICAFPDETRDDFRDTIHFFIDSRRFDRAEPQLSLLAPLAATPIHARHKDELVLDHIFSDMSHQGWNQDPLDIELIKCHPEVFPNFYSVPTRWLPRDYFKQVRDFSTYVVDRFRWLPVALLQDSGDFLCVFDLWKQWIDAKGAGVARASGIVPYYCGNQFREDFLEFVSSCYIPSAARAPLAIAAIVRSEATHQVKSATQVDVPRTDRLNGANYPFWAEKCSMQEVGVDYKELIEALRAKRDLLEVAERPTTLVFRQENEKQVRVWQIPPICAALMHLCDGKHTVDEIKLEFAIRSNGVVSVPPEKSCLFGLLTLRDKGFVEIATHPVIREETLNVDDVLEASSPRYVPPPEMSNTQQPWPWTSTG